MLTTSEFPDALEFWIGAVFLGGGTIKEKNIFKKNRKPQIFGGDEKIYLKKSEKSRKQIKPYR